MSTRRIAKIFKSRPTMEGAGVHLKRAFGYSQVPQFDPFLMLDDFHTSNPDEYLAGFPWHPHRGIETITYVLEGLVEHGDSMGNHGAIGAGDVPWMTAGNGFRTRDGTYGPRHGGNGHAGAEMVSHVQSAAPGSTWLGLLAEDVSSKDPAGCRRHEPRTPMAAVRQTARLAAHRLQSP